MSVAVKKSTLFLYRQRRLFCLFGALMCVLSCFSVFASATDPTATDSIDQVLDVMDRFTDKAIGPQGVGAKVITFVTSNPLLLIGVASFILVMLVGLVRRFITGV